MTRRDETDPGLELLSGADDAPSAESADTQILGTPPPPRQAPPAGPSAYPQPPMYNERSIFAEPGEQPAFWGAPGQSGPPPGGPGQGGPPEPRRRSTPGWLIALVAVLAVVAVVLVVVAIRAYTGSSSSNSASPSGAAAPTVTVTSSVPAPTSGQASSAPASTAPATSSAVPSTSAPATPQQAAARQLDALLAQSVAARAGVQPALNDIAACRTTQADLDALAKAAATRRQLVAQLGAADLTALPQGPQLTSLLQTVWNTSAAADDAYVQWGQAQAGCHGHAARDAHAKQGDALSAQATSAKTSFVGVWAPIAKAQKLPARSETQI